MGSHSGHYPYTCEYCSKGFTSLTHLKDHLPIHTNKHYWHCAKCGDDFRTAYILKKHKAACTGVRKVPVAEEAVASSDCAAETCRRGFSEHSEHKRACYNEGEMTIARGATTTEDNGAVAHVSESNEHIELKACSNGEEVAITRDAPSAMWNVPKDVSDKQIKQE